MTLVGQTIRVLTTQGEGVVRRIHRDGRPIVEFVSYLNGKRGEMTIEVDAPYEVIEGPPKPWIATGDGETFRAGPGERPLPSSQPSGRRRPSTPAAAATDTDHTEL